MELSPYSKQVANGLLNVTTGSISCFVMKKAYYLLFYTKYLYFVVTGTFWLDNACIVQPKRLMAFHKVLMAKKSTCSPNRVLTHPLRSTDLDSMGECDQIFLSRCLYFEITLFFFLPNIRSVQQSFEASR